MAGTISLSLSQQFDSQGVPLSGGLLYFFEAGTTTPQSAFQDQALTITYPNPIELDASGRVPAFYLADGNIKIRLTDDSGVTIIAADNLLVVGPSTGGGGGGSVDATTVLATGDIKARYGTGTLDGFVRCNGRTIGSALSGGTERANADCQTLFEYLWTTAVLGVEPSRGASANADWLANSRILLPDLRGRTIAGMDDMGTTAASRLTSAFFGVSATTLGNAAGTQGTTLGQSQIPIHTHTQQGSFASGNETADHTHSIAWSGTTTIESGDHTHAYGTSLASATSGAGTFTIATGTTNQTGGVSANHTHSYSGSGNSGTVSAFHTHNTTLSGETGANSGFGSTQVPIVQPAMVLTFYLKL